ncbi:glycosyltransferase [Barrientosiimonas humi]|uniref:glycosyltransferase n=1 Tax=Barrientosiimonas humi TaxID=999931 RepID=UPI00370D0992
MIERPVMGVVVPARDEEALLPECLEHLQVAVDELHRRTRWRARAVVVLDSCTDGSAGAVAAAAGVEALTISAGNVGLARAAGADHLLRTGVAVSWLACTDADSRVPRSWLCDQVEAHSLGIELVMGSVLPDARSLTPAQLAAWLARHDLGDGHEHVFGANLGISARAYAHVGGFAPLPLHEDVDLVRRVRAAGFVWHARGGDPVITSARRVGRAAGGFATDLRLRLAEPVPTDRPAELGADAQPAPAPAGGPQPLSVVPSAEPPSSQARSSSSQASVRLRASSRADSASSRVS